MVTNIRGYNVDRFSVDHHQSVCFQSSRYFDDLEQTRVEYNNDIRFRDISTNSDLFVADADERLDGGTPPFRAESRKSLSVFPFGDCGLGYEFGRGDCTLAAAAMESDGDDVSVNNSPP